MIRYLWLAFMLFALPSLEAQEEKKPKSVQELVQALEDPNPLVRARAAMELETRSNEATSAVPALIRLLDDRTPLVWVHCFNNDCPPIGLSPETSPTPETSPATEAANALALLNSRSALEPLKGLLRSGADYERQAAAWALSNIDPVGTFNVLLLASAYDKTVGSQIAGTVERSVKDRPMDMRMIRDLLTLLSTTPVEGVQLASIQALKKVREPLAVPILSSLAVRGAAIEVKEAASEALDAIFEAGKLPSYWKLVLGVVGLGIGVLFAGFLVMVMISDGVNLDKVGALLLYALPLAGASYYFGVADFYETRSLRHAFESREVAALVRSIESCAPSFECDAAVLLVITKDNTAMRQLLDLLARLDARDRLWKGDAALWTFARLMESEDGRAAAQQLAADKDVSIRRILAWTLASAPDPANADLLGTLAKDPDPKVRKTAAQALVSL